MWKYLRTLRWPPRRLVLWQTVAAIPMATVVVLGAYLSYHYHRLGIENRERVDRAYQVLDVVDGLYISIQNANVAVRDFILTEDDSDLASFRAALKTESEDSARLRELLAASKAQQSSLTRIDQAVAATLSALGQTIVLRQQQGFEAARQAIRHGDDGRAMAAIRQQVTALAQNERRLLMRRQAATREHERDALLVGIFIAALSVTVRLLIALGIRHVHAKRQAQIAPSDGSGEAPTAGQAGADAATG